MVSCVDELSIGQTGAESGAEWPLSVVALGPVQFVRPFCNAVVALYAGLCLITEVRQELESIFDAGLGLRQHTIQFFTLLLTLGIVSKHLTVSEGRGVDGVKHEVRCVDELSIGLRRAVPMPPVTVLRVAYRSRARSCRILLRSDPGASGRALLQK